jgi:hypothetical protein
MQASLRTYQGALDTGRPDSWEPGARSHFDFYFCLTASLVWEKKLSKTDRNYGGYWAIGRLQEPR